MNTWANLVTQFALDPTCQRMSALFVAITFSALSVCTVVWLIYKVLEVCVFYTWNKIKSVKSIEQWRMSWVTRLQLFFS